MRTPQFRTTRVVIVLLLVFLAIQFELGMAINLAPSLPSLPQFGFSIPLIIQALQKIGGVGLLHAGVGIFLLLLAIVNLILALSSGVRGVQIFGVLGFLSTLLEVYSGILFTMSGFTNDSNSHSMATNFLLSMIFFFLELYVLKPAPKERPTSGNS